MANFDDMLAYASDSAAPVSTRHYTYKEGVKTLYMQENSKNGVKKIFFRLLPAFNNDITDPNAFRTSWVPSIMPDGSMSTIGSFLFSAKFCGRGDFKNRHEIVSRKTADRNAVCPYEVLCQFIRANKSDWGYLFEDVGQFRKPGYVKATLSQVQPKLLANVIDMYDQTATVKVGEFPPTAWRSMMAKGDKPGLMFVKNTVVPQEWLQKSYLYQYANGDVTDPENGLVLEVSRDDSPNAAFQGYTVAVAKGADGGPWRQPVSAQKLATRYDLRQATNVVNVPTEQELVDELASFLNQRSPHGYHEYALLKMAFQEHGWRVPEPPTAPAATSTVAPGFQPQQAPVQQAPVQQPPVQQVPPQGGFTPRTLPSQAPVAVFNGAPAQVQQPPVQQPPVQQPPVQQPPAYVPRPEPTPEPAPVQQPPVQQPAPAVQQPPVQQPASGFAPSPGFRGVAGETRPLSPAEIVATLKGSL